MIMKTIFLFILLFSLTGWAQSVTNVTVTCIAKLDNGTSTTNTAAVSNTNILSAVQYAIDTLNVQRVAAGQVLVTNYSQYVIVSASSTITQALNDYDAAAIRKLSELISVLTPEEKAQLRSIAAAH